MDVKEEGIQIRVPATANLMIDSQDRNPLFAPATPANFLITKSESLLNGFFNRIATSEVVLEWTYPNISLDLSSNAFAFNVGGTDYVATVPTGLYTVRSLLYELIGAMNVVAPGVPAPGFTESNPYPGGAFVTAPVAWSVNACKLATWLNIPVGPAIAGPGAGEFSVFISTPDLRPFRYLDFVSEQLTYNQRLKDDSTNSVSRSALCRWYFAWDNQENLDEYGFPILMGYQPFTLRRIFNPPKQIKWDPRMPVGQVSFQVYADTQPFPVGPNQSEWDWLMTCQVSEN